MSFSSVRKTAGDAASLARANHDEPMALLAEAVAELARSLDKELRDIKTEVDRIRRQT